MNKINLPAILNSKLSIMAFNITRPGLGDNSVIPISVLVLISIMTILGIKDSQAQVSGTDYNTQSSLQPELQMQCPYSPVLPQADQPITVSAKVVDESLAANAADSIEIIIDTNRTEPVVPSNSITSSSRLNYTFGPFTNLTTISYGCRAIDNSTSTSLFTGMKQIVVGAFNESNKAIPILFTGNRIINMDILFIADNKSFSGPTDPNFLIDVERAIGVYYNQSILLKYQNKTNFWIAQDMGQIKNNCESIPPTNWHSEYPSYEAAVILHRDGSIRDCTMPGKGISTANMEKVTSEGYLLLHEIGHRPFGLADEYDNPGFFISSYPYQNVFNSLQDCESYIQETQASDLFALEKICRKIPYEDSLEYFTADTKPNDLMVDNKQFQDLDKRRIQKWFEFCLAPPDSKQGHELDCEAEKG
jgi:hypothetical protein